MKELHRTALRGGALEASCSAAVSEGEGPGSCTHSDINFFHFSFSSVLYFLFSHDYCVYNISPFIKAAVGRIEKRVDLA